MTVKDAYYSIMRSQENLFGLCPKCKSRKTREKINRLWKDESYIYRYFKGRLFGKNYKPNELDKKIIRTRIRLFKIHKKGGETHETGRL